MKDRTYEGCNSEFSLRSYNQVLYHFPQREKKNKRAKSLCSYLEVRKQNVRSLLLFTNICSMSEHILTSENHLLNYINFVAAW